MGVVFGVVFEVVFGVVFVVVFVVVGDRGNIVVFVIVLVTCR